MRYFRKSILGLGLIIGVGTGTAAFACVAPAGQERQFSSEAGALVNDALEDINAENHAQAILQLQTILAMPELSAYERSTLQQMLGSSYYEEGNYSAAIGAFEHAISACGLLPSEISALRVNIAQLLIANGRPAEGAQMLEDWAEDGGALQPKHIEFLWQAWSQAEQYDRALPWAEKWFEAANPKQRKHYDVLNFLYHNLQMPEEQAVIILQMLEQWPQEKGLWNALASLYAGNGKERDAFEVKISMYENGLLDTEAELLVLVQYYAYYDIPYWGAILLEREMNMGRIGETAAHLEQLADLWQQAREHKRAIPVLEAVANTTRRPISYLRLSEAYIHEGHCGKADQRLAKYAQQSGGDLQLMSAKLYGLLGACYYEKSQDFAQPGCDAAKTMLAKNPRYRRQKQAIQAFNKSQALHQVPNNQDTNTSWIKFIKAEQDLVQEKCAFRQKVEKQGCLDAYERQKNGNFLNTGANNIDPVCAKYLTAPE